MDKNRVKCQFSSESAGPGCTPTSCPSPSILRFTSCWLILTFLLTLGQLALPLSKGLFRLAVQKFASPFLFFSRVYQLSKGFITLCPLQCAFCQFLAPLCIDSTPTNIFRIFCVYVYCPFSLKSKTYEGRHFSLKPLFHWMF